SQKGVGPRPILNDELLAQSFRQPLSDQARDDIGGAAGRKADDDAHRSRRIILRPCSERDHREGSSICCRPQKSTACKIDAEPGIRLSTACAAYTERRRLRKGRRIMAGANFVAA